MSSPPQLHTVRVAHHFDASPQRVFDAWLDPEKARRWLFATPTGQMVRADIDARVGGSFNFTDRREDGDVEHVGTYLEIDRPRRLVFTFAVPKFSAQYTKVTIEIAPSSGGCELTLTHEGVLPEWSERTQEGWGKLLRGLGTSVDPNNTFGVLVEPGTIRFERILPGPIERVWEYLNDAQKRGLWFAAGEIDPRVGGTIELQFRRANGERETFYKQHITRYEPPRVLAWNWDGGIDGPSEVTFELSQQQDKVLLVLTHRRIANRYLANIASGWHEHLDLLVKSLGDSQAGAPRMILTQLEEHYARQFPSE